MTFRPFVLLPILLVASAGAVDLTGAWTFEWTPDFGGQPSTTHECQVKQQNGVLAIQCDGQAMKGKLRGNTATFEHTTGLKSELKATYKVTVDPKGTTMKGSWHLSGPEGKVGKFLAHKH
jgi:hypothetical protein